LQWRRSIFVVDVKMRLNARPISVYSALNSQANEGKVRQCQILPKCAKNAKMSCSILQARICIVTKLAIGYVRVSTGKQAEGLSPDAQKKRIKQWCKANGYTLLTIHSDNGKSGKNLKDRPGVLKAIARACKEGATLVFYSLSRLARNTRETMEIADQLGKANANMVSLTEPIDTTSAAGKMFFQMMAVMSEFERNLRSEQAIDSAIHRRSLGLPVGRIPYGQRLVDGKLADNPDETKAVNRMKRLRDEGYSYRMIATIIGEEGFVNRKGNSKWNHSVISHILNRIHPESVGENQT